MHWKFDIDQRSLVRAFDDLSVKSAKLAFPDKYPIKIDFYRGATPFSFSGKLRATVKATNRQQSPALAVMEVTVATADTAEGVLNLSTTAMQKFVKDFGERPAAMEVAVLNNAGAQIASWVVNCEVSRRYTDTGDVAIDIPDSKATKAEAEAGVNNEKWVTVVRVWDAIRKWAADNFKWANLADKPLVFPPASHTHTAKDDIKQALEAAGIEVL
jgi:hypothetical protein